jgi:mycoredoxin
MDELIFLADDDVPAAPHRQPRPITIFGRPTCEDTAIVRDRLTRYGIPFTEADVDRDEGAGRLCEAINAGNRSTPTILFGGTEDALTEPALDALDERLVAEGWSIRPPEPTQFAGSLIATPVPLLTIVDDGGAAFRVSQFRGRRQLAVFFAHDAVCMTCAGYARQLAAVKPKLADGDALALVVVPGEASDAARWRAEATSQLPILADHGGRWKCAVAAHVQFDVDRPGAMLLGLDRYLAPRIGSAAPDAGGLIAPRKAAEWLEFASFECAECATPVGWGDD